MKTLDAHLHAVRKLDKLTGQDSLARIKAGPNPVSRTIKALLEVLRMANACTPALTEACLLRGVGEAIAMETMGVQAGRQSP